MPQHLRCQPYQAGSHHSIRFSCSRRCGMSFVRGTTTHTTGVIGCDTTDFTGIDRGWVWADFTLERSQVFIGISANHTRLKDDLITVVYDLMATPVIGQCDEYRVWKRLARKGCTACGAKGKVNAEFATAV